MSFTNDPLLPEDQASQMIDVAPSGPMRTSEDSASEQSQFDITTGSSSGTSDLGIARY